MILGLLIEKSRLEQRVALAPTNIKKLVDLGLTVIVEENAGERSGFTDDEYTLAGASLRNDRKTIISRADILVQVQAFGFGYFNESKDCESLKAGQVVIGCMDPLTRPEIAEFYAEKQVTAIALELVPRISRAQGMDMLSSMATIAGYKAVLMAAEQSNRMFPMLMTAAGTVAPSRVFIIGAGVAGLQAAATAKKLGARVEAYDVRPAAREQILSVGVTPISLDLETKESEGKGGYAKAQSDDFIARQQQLMTDVLARQDVVITTAAIPGKTSPVLITKGMVEQMKPGSVIIDLAAERGGNCELTILGTTVNHHGVTIIGPDNIQASVAHHASQLIGKNIENLVSHLLDNEGKLQLDFTDEIIADTVLCHKGKVSNPRIQNLLDVESQRTGTE